MKKLILSRRLLSKDRGARSKGGGGFKLGPSLLVRGGEGLGNSDVRVANKMTSKNV